ncbi:hypothetical protein OG739_03665 [Streptomyces longwoodensis]|jgi:hypothetical protein|uniref:Uncharacterized protein n=2 Tax=Streptomyces TaxID=1883 RepID=A0A124HS91_9ACTN|nr:MULTISPECIES: hypothetical protein [Streptomyces]KUN40932.1 hypothetical protein AQJ30_03245 [Streptomyces longwoodensis]MCX5000182.1 hypothetical protein [Streptomyces longwoodensis]TKS99106.1 hypothetical protein E4U91_02550 [Streptomyces lasalocidi]WTI48891.1 hypothetical protein OG547_32410 [Streptomyces longwoodensis]WUC61588.1 hypothetical protein OHA09_33065 [Streptomyces longwoodensis]
MASAEKTVEEVRIRDVDLEAVLDPAEADGVYRDSRECAALAVVSGGGSALLSPPTPRPKKG